MSVTFVGTTGPKEAVLRVKETPQTSIEIQVVFL